MGSCDVRLARLILHHAGNEIQDVAIILRAGIDDVDHVKAPDGFLGGDLRGIDRWRRFVDVDDLANFLLMRDGNFDGRTGRDLHVGLNGCVEAFFFHA